jgi:potassium/hydrogen antiporter
MDSVWLFLLSIAGIFLIGALGEITFQRTNIPDVIWLILAGILLGPVFDFVTREQLRSIAPYFAALTLVVVLFEGGSALRLGELSRAAPRSSALALLSFGFAVLALSVFSMGARELGLLPESWSWMHGFMLGTILGGSSSIIIMPAMAQARLAPKIANLVNLESALTDAFCVVGTVALMDILLGSSSGNPLVSLLRSFGIGLAVGGAAGLVWLFFLRFLRSAEHAYPVTLSALLILYVVIDNLGGSAALGILTVAVLLGNAASLSKVLGLSEVVELGSSVRGFHRQMAFIVKSFFFVFIGAMLGPPWSPLLFGLLLGSVLLAARLPAVRLATLGGGFDPAERQMVMVSLPRGMAAGVLATLPASKGVVGTETLPVTVFATVLTTILIFAVGFPIARRKLPQGDPSLEVEVPLPAGAARPSLTPPPVLVPAMVTVASTSRTSVATEVGGGEGDAP